MLFIKKTVFFFIPTSLMMGSTFSPLTIKQGAFMKVFMGCLLTLTSVSAFAQSKEAATTYKVDTEASKVLWVGKKVTGQHNGVIKIKSGTLITKGLDLVGGEIVIDMNSLDVQNITDAETKGKFQGHMKSADFFDVEKFPEAKI